MQIIRYHEMENLLKLYKTIESSISTIQYDLQKIQSYTVNDFIETASLKRSQSEDIIVHTRGHTGDKTGNIAINLQKSFEKEMKEMNSQLNTELLLLQMAIDKINIGLSALPEMSRKTIVHKYFDGLQWLEIEELLPFSTPHLQRFRKQGIETIRVVSRVSIKQYELITGLLSANCK